MKIKIMQGDTGCCASDCEFKNDHWCNLFFAELFGEGANPTRFPSCMMMTDTNAEFYSLRFVIDETNKCFGCRNYRKGFPKNCTAGNLCNDGTLHTLNRYRG